MPARMCQYANCLEVVGELGVTVSLKTPTFDSESRAIYCCAAHAVAALQALANARKELPVEIPARWRFT